MKLLTFSKLILVVAGGLALASCASMSKEECLAGDWGKYGFDDGAAGYPESRIAEHHEACAEHDVTPDRALYLQGRARGLLKYCTPEGGWRAGRARDSYANVCTGEAEKPFLDAYRLGKEVGDARAAASSARTSANLAESATKGAVSKDDPAVHARATKARAKARELEFKATHVESSNRQIYVHLYGGMPPN
jgi:hypothetical protein